MDIKCCILVGAGGTGSHLAEPLARLITYHKKGLRNSTQGMIIVDGDKFDAGNHTRQLGTAIDKYKAQAMAERLRESVPGLTTIPVCQYVDKLSFRRLILDGVKVDDKGAKDLPILVILSVDNHTTRRDCYQALHEMDIQNALILSPGNDAAHGQCLVWARHKGKDLTPYPLAVTPDGVTFHPEILDPPANDKRPGGCHAAVASGVQRVSANAMAAMSALLIVEAWLNDEPIPDEMRFECSYGREGRPKRQMGMRACGTPIDLRAAQGMKPKPIIKSPSDLSGIKGVTLRDINGFDYNHNKGSEVTFTKVTEQGSYLNFHFQDYLGRNDKVMVTSMDELLTFMELVA